MSIILFTDFGSQDLYVGQVKAVLQREAPGMPVIDLMNDVPAFDIEAGAHLLSALERRFDRDDVFLAVVDPGVGGPRAPAVVWADGKWFVGPDNGLLSIVAQRAKEHKIWHIHWRPPELSVSFHGRDLFAPMAAWIAKGVLPFEKLTEKSVLDVQLTLSVQRIIFVDHYGNCMTSIPGTAIQQDALIQSGSMRLRHSPTFSEAQHGKPFWYVNSIGLVEIAMNQGNAADAAGLHVGSAVQVF